jgi:hypothetical protein
VEKHRDELDDKDDAEKDDKQHTNWFQLQIFLCDVYLKLYKTRVSMLIYAE